MTDLGQFLEQLTTPSFIGIALLMLSTFLLGYFFSSYGERSSKSAKIKDLKKQINAFKILEQKKDIETLFSEIKPKIIQVVKEQQQQYKQEQEQSKPIAETTDSLQKNSEKILSKTRSAYVNYSLSTPSLDFKAIGFGDKHHKDTLTDIDGIGPYIEQKLFEIGLYNFEQISRLQIRDIKILTTLIDFFPGRIERDNWVSQAKNLSLIKK